MSFPQSSRVVFDHNPIVEVICQLRFPTILAIAAEIPAGFQELVRHKYPLYEKNDLSSALPKEIAPLFGQLGLPSPAAGIGHKFLTADSARTIGLTPDFVAVSQSNYKRWEEFFDEIVLAEHAVEQKYHPAFYTRVGLRYRNVIDRNSIGLENAKWADLLQPYFTGMLARDEVSGNIESAQSDIIIALSELEGARVRIRHGLVTNQDAGTDGYMIDADFSLDGSCDHDRAFQALRTFNGLAGHLFRWAITPVLHRALQPMDP
jgi:uncharacterized protein (TIGR04255 family)